MTAMLPMIAARRFASRAPLSGRARSAAGAWGLAAVLALALAGPAEAQTTPAPAAAGNGAGGSETPFSGFGGGGKGPIAIESNELEVHDKQGIAIFTGNVIAKQAESTLQAEKLVVHYVQGGQQAAGGAAPAAAPAPAATPAASGQAMSGAGGQQIEKLEATGKVLLTDKDQTASGDAAVYEAKSDTMVMTGNVVLTQNGNVVKGNRLVVNLTTGEAKVFANKRVQMLLVPSQAPAAPGAPAPKSN